MMNRASFRVRSFGSSVSLSAAFGACACVCVVASGLLIAAAVTANPALRKTSRRSVSFMASLRLCIQKLRVRVMADRAKPSNRLDHCYRTGNAFASDVEGAAVRECSKQDGAADHERGGLLGRVQVRSSID